MPQPGHAPRRADVRDEVVAKPTIVPSSLKATAKRWTCSRAPMSSVSRRSSIHFTGRPISRLTRADERLLGMAVHLQAEAAADVRGDDADLRLVDVERVREHPAQRVRVLRRAVEGAA